jgi:hypothetical protein
MKISAEDYEEPTQEVADYWARQFQQMAKIADELKEKNVELRSKATRLHEENNKLRTRIAELEARKVTTGMVPLCVGGHLLGWDKRTYIASSINAALRKKTTDDQ